MEVKSGSWCKKSIKGTSGLIKIIFTGDRIVDTVDSHCTCDPEPNKDQGGSSKRTLVANRNVAVKMTKRVTNLIFDIFIHNKHSNL